MLLIPKSKTKIGLIQTLHIKGVTRAISTNYNDRRKEYPINYTSTDRWCSGSVEETEHAWWEVTFDHWIYPTNYTFQNNEHSVVPTKWRLEGKRKNEWILLHEVTSSHIGNDDYDTFPIIVDDGPFQTFRFVSGKNAWSSNDEGYFFCIYKIEFFGMAFKYLCPFSPIKQNTFKIRYHTLFIFLML